MLACAGRRRARQRALRGRGAGAQGRAEAHAPQLEQRAGELTIINSIQQGMAGSLDFQGIVDLVGDKLREVLRIDDIGIALVRSREPALIQLLYAVEHGERLRPAQPDAKPGGPAER